MMDKKPPEPWVSPLVSSTKEGAHDDIRAMVDEAQREAQPDLDAIMESRKTPLRGHWAKENNDE
jgi:hypothetical protein